MAIEVTFELSDADLEHFRGLLKTAYNNAEKYSLTEIQQKTQGCIDELVSQNLPDFVAQRVESLKVLLRMVDDQQWQLPDEDKQEILTSLAYFCEPEDLVPDNIPVVGYLDDAIMIELVVQDLAANIEAYLEFCEFRDTESQRRNADISMDDWLASKRLELQHRMREKRRNRSSHKVFSRIF